MGKQASKRFRALRKVYANQAKRLRLYRAIKARFMLEHPICQACEKVNLHVGYPLRFSKFADDIHHSRGKVGELLFDTRFFFAVCRTCHRYLHDHPAIARQLGFLCEVGQWNTMPKNCA